MCRNLKIVMTPKPKCPAFQPLSLCLRSAQPRSVPLVIDTYGMIVMMYHCYDLTKTSHLPSLSHDEPNIKPSICSIFTKHPSEVLWLYRIFGVINPTLSASPTPILRDIHKPDPRQIHRKE